MAFFGHLNSKVMELQHQLAQDHGQFATLNLEVDKTLDKLRLFETKVDGDVQEGKIQAQVAVAKVSDVESDMTELKSRLEGVISDLNGHIGGSFSVVEEEFKKLQQNLEAVGIFAVTSHATQARGSNQHAGNIFLLCKAAYTPLSQISRNLPRGPSDSSKHSNSIQLHTPSH